MSITEQNLTSFDNDIFARKIIAENLTKIIDSQSKPMVISLDSAWGTGKTTFVTMWKDLLDSAENYNSKFKTLYFNAWEHDYSKDPLISIICEIEDQIKEEDSILKQKFETAISKLKPLAKFGITSLLKIGTAGLLDLKDVNFGDLTEEQLVDIVGQVGDLSIKEAASNKKVRENFKQYMNEYQQESGKKIIFFIDELDRCRPTFAIELLEVIKHLFDIENFVFIISIDKEQLSHSVSTIYGQNMDTVGYLRRFFDLDYKLPKIDFKKYIEYKSSLVFKDKLNIDLFDMFIKEMFIQEKFSLRDIDKSYYYINLLIPLIEVFNEEKRYNSVYIATISYLYSILITIKIKYPILYKNIVDREYEVNDIINKINIPNLEHYEHNIVGGWHHKPLQEVIEQVLRPFLYLYLISYKKDYIIPKEEDEFVVGLKDNNGKISFDNRFNLVNLFNNEKIDIINNLEFINSFQIN